MPTAFPAAPAAFIAGNCHGGRDEWLATFLDRVLS